MTTTLVASVLRTNSVSAIFSGSSTGSNTSAIQFVDGSLMRTAPLEGYRNKIINGDMRIRQRGGDTSLTPTNGQYWIDRWINYSLNASSTYTVTPNHNNVTRPRGFSDYMGIVSNAATSVTATMVCGVAQSIEASNIQHLQWGTTAGGNAVSARITLSFWVRSSLTGTFSGAFKNFNGTRNYAFTYTISAANTWEKKFITIIGDNTGTWYPQSGLSAAHNWTENRQGLVVVFSLGTGSTYLTSPGAWTATDAYGATGSVNVIATSGATWYLTGVQLERGIVGPTGDTNSPSAFSTTDTGENFEFRPMITEYQMCQRYFYRSADLGASPLQNGLQSGAGSIHATGVLQERDSVTGLTELIKHPVSMRIAPSIVYYRTQLTTQNGTWSLYNSTNGWYNPDPVNSFAQSNTTEGFSMTFTNLSGKSATKAGMWYGAWDASAEF